MLLARTKAGISKRGLAKLAGLDASYISHIEAGRRKPSLDTIEKIAEILSVPLPLLMLLSADTSDLKGISPEEATAMGERLLSLLAG